MQRIKHNWGHGMQVAKQQRKILPKLSNTLKWPLNRGVLTRSMTQAFAITKEKECKKTWPVLFNVTNQQLTQDMQVQATAQVLAMQMEKVY